MQKTDPKSDPKPESPVPMIYAMIAEVMKDIGATGIAKERKNVEQRYQFRGIDDVYNALSPILARHGVCILPRVLSRTCEAREARSGAALYSVTVEVEFDLCCAADGSRHTIRTIGEAMDSADKATNKATSAAFKYAAMQAFCIPTEGDNDADARTPEDSRYVEPTSAAHANATRFVRALADRNDERCLTLHEELLADPQLYELVQQVIPGETGEQIRAAIIRARKARAEAVRLGKNPYDDKEIPF